MNYNEVSPPLEAASTFGSPEMEIDGTPPSNSRLIYASGPLPDPLPGGKGGLEQELQSKLQMPRIAC